MPSPRSQSVQKLHFSDFKGKVIYIDLWATWCGPCIQESPAFEALGKKYVGKGNSTRFHNVLRLKPAYSFFLIGFKLKLMLKDNLLCNL